MTTGIRRLLAPVFLLVISAAPPSGGRAIAAPRAHPLPSNVSLATASHQPALTEMESAPLAFEENVGQFAPTIRFVAQTEQGSIALTNTGIVITPAVTCKAAPRSATGTQREASCSGASSAKATPVTFRFAGAMGRPHVTGLTRTRGWVNRFIGNQPRNWYRHIPLFSRVSYRGVYPGIDAVFYSRHGQLEYDWILHPGALPGHIRLVVSGGTLSRDRQGHIIVRTPLGKIEQRTPALYQRKDGVARRVKGAFVLTASGRIRLTVGRYNPRLPLIVDPTVRFSTYAGAAWPTNIAADTSGHVFVSGYVWSGPLPDSTNSHAADSNSQDAYVTAFDASSGAILYSTYVGGSKGDVANAVAVDTSGHVFIAGSTSSSDLPAATNAFTSASYYGDAFVTKLDSATGAILSSTYFGGSSDDAAWGIAADTSGHIYIAGKTTSTVLPGVVTAYAGNSDAFVAKLDATSGSVLWSTYVGGSNLDYGYGVAVDSSGHVFVAGQTASSSLPNETNAPGGDYDGFLSELDASTGAIQFSTYVGGSGDEGAWNVAVNPAGAVFIAGWSNAAGLPAATNAYSGHSFDALVSRIDPVSGAVLFSTYVGGSGGEQSYGLAADGSGRLFITGGPAGADLPASTPQECPSNCGNSFVTELNSSTGGILSSLYVGGSGPSQTMGLAVDPADHIFISGTTGSSDLPDATNTAPGGAFVMELNYNVTIASTVTGNLGQNGWYVGDVSVSWSIDDAGEAIAAKHGCGSTVITHDTSGTTLTCSITNAAGVTSRSVTIKRDTTPPTVTGTADRRADLRGTYTHTLKVTWLGRDAGSGIASCDAPMLYAGPDGRRITIHGACTDAAGNTGRGTFGPFKFQGPAWTGPTPADGDVITVPSRSSRAIVLEAAGSYGAKLTITPLGSLPAFMSCRNMLNPGNPAVVGCVIAPTTASFVRVSFEARYPDGTSAGVRTYMVGSGSHR